MFITKKHIPRRAFLRAAGVTLALPLLDSMIPAQTPLSRTAAVPKTRFTGIFVPHGMAPGYWIPEGPTLETGKMLTVMQPLDPFLNQTVIMSGLWSKSAEPPPGVTGADHWVAAAYLCANKPKKTTGSDIEDGTTIDQLIAQKIGQETLVPSLQLAIEDPGANSSNCGEGYSCAYTNSISWASPTQPLPMELNPQVVFEQLEQQGLALVLTPAAKLLLAEHGYDPQLGARPLRRAIQQMIEDPLSERILWKEFRVGETIVVDTETVTAEGVADAESKGERPVVIGEQRLTFKAVEGVEPPPVELAGAGADTD
jgi:hypothetical protein